MIEQALRAHRRIDAELLWHVAERLAYIVLLLQHVDLAEADAAFIGLLQWPACASARERDVLQRLHAVGVRLGDAAHL
jgi:hypothetical protein